MQVELTDYLNLLEMARYAVRMAESYSSYSTVKQWTDTLEKLEATPLDDGRTQGQRDAGYMRKFLADCREMGAD